MFRESLHKLVAYLNDGKAVAREALEGKILNLLEKKGPLTRREIAQRTHFDGDTVRKKLEGLVKDGDITATRQGKKTVYCIIHEEVING